MMCNFLAQLQARKTSFARSRSGASCLALWAATAAFTIASGSTAMAGFLDKVVKAVTSPVATVLQGKVTDIPKVVVNTLGGGAVVDTVANTVGGSVGQLMKDARAAGPTATMNLTNVQFIQSVLAIKAAKANGLIKDSSDCHTLAQKITSAVHGYASNDPMLIGVADDQTTMTRMLGDAACDTAIPGSPGSPPGAPPVAALPPAAINALPFAPGFDGNSIQVHPIAQCTMGQNPFFAAGGFLLMSDLTAANWNPMAMQWFPVAQLQFDGTGAFYLRGPGPGMMNLLVGFDGKLYALNVTTNMVTFPLGQCV